MLERTPIRGVAVHADVAALELALRHLETALHVPTGALRSGLGLGLGLG